MSKEIVKLQFRLPRHLRNKFTAILKSKELTENKFFNETVQDFVQKNNGDLENVLSSHS